MSIEKTLDKYYAEKNKEPTIAELGEELERRTKLLEQVITVANMVNRVHLGQPVEWDELGLSDVKEFESDLDIISWPKQEFVIDCKEKYKGDPDCGGCKK